MCNVALPRAIQSLENLKMRAICFLHRLKQVTLLVNYELGVFDKQKEVLAEETLCEVLLVLRWQSVDVGLGTVQVPQIKFIDVINVLVDWLCVLPVGLVH